MTTIGKCLAVLTAFGCLAFLGFVSVSMVGGPGFEKHLEDPVLKNRFIFTPTDNEETGKRTWTVTTRRKRRNQQGQFEDVTVVKDAKVLADAIIKARKFARDEDRREIEGDPSRNLMGINQKIALLKPKIEEVKRLIAIDDVALKRRLTEAQALLAAKKKEYADNADTINSETLATIKVREEAIRRREDISRLKQQIAEIQADLYRAGIQREKMRVLIVELSGAINRLEERRAILIAAGADPNYDGKPSGAQPAATNSPEN